jgi:hypothetical protein
VRPPHAGRAAALLAGLIAALGAAAGVGPAAAEVIGMGTWELEVDGDIRPRTLPRSEVAPIRLRLGAEVRGLGGQPGPALRRMIFDLDRSVRLSARGLPHCRRRQLRDSRSRRAKRICGGALVGRGRVEGLIEPPDQRPLEVRGPVLAFNGPRRGGAPTIVFHIFARVPAPTVFVSGAKIGRAPGRRFGRRLRLDLPRLAGGGRITAASLRLRRRWRYRGESRSYLSASCRRGRLVALMRLRFRDAEDVKGGFARRCRLRS